MLESLLLMSLMISGAPQEAAPVNPTTVIFVCSDHDLDDQHELKILRLEGDHKVVITTILLGDPPYLPLREMAKEVSTTLNMQPIAFGTYVATVNAIAGEFKSPDSPESNVFVRAPGGPSKVIVR
jgi:hypothetical protein